MERLTNREKNPDGLKITREITTYEDGYMTYAVYFHQEKSDTFMEAAEQALKKMEDD